MSGAFESAEHRLQCLSKEKARLVELLLDKKSGKTRRIGPTSREGGTKAVTTLTSWAQQRLWFIDQLEGTTAPYHLALALRLRGVLEVSVLQDALNTIVTRHEVLRARFSSVDGEPRQEVAPNGEFDLKVIDLSAVASQDREQQVRLQKTDEVQGRFDLRNGPMIRGRLLRLQAEEHVLLVTMHHIVSDGWSMAVFFRELSELYRGYREGRVDVLEPLAIQYADYAQWQREIGQGEVWNRELDYWRARLNGAALRMELPTDRPRPAIQSYRGENLKFVMDGALCAKLTAFARQRQMTLFMVLYAGYSILLSRLGRQNDVLIGTPIVNRHQAELEALIGLFVNTLVLRVEVRGDAPVEEFLSQVKEVALGAYAHRDLPFDRLVEVLQPRRSLSHHPVFQVMLTMQNVPKSEFSAPGVTSTVEDGVNEPAMCDLLLFLDHRGDEIVGTVNFATDLFDRETVQRWMVSFTVLLTEMVRKSSQKIRDLHLISADQSLWVIKTFNPREELFPHNKLIHELFEEQVCVRPDAVAVASAGKALTYAELNARANQVARYLLEKGVSPDQVVGLCVERSPELAVCILGVLKAGGAYLPLDPTYPAERLNYMLRDAAPKVVLIQDRVKEQLPDTIAQAVLLDTEWKSIAERSPRNLDSGALGLHIQQLAYVLYTSGSTGVPKGVMVEHRNVTRLFANTEGLFGFNERDVWAMFHSFAFDFSVWELWGALLYGGRVVVVPYLTTRSPCEFYGLVCREGVTVLNQTPSAFAQLADAQPKSAEQRNSIRVVIFGGESLEFRTLQSWLDRNDIGMPRLVNMYGITETTVHVTYRHISQMDIESERGSLVGRPIRDLRVYLLDECRTPLPIGFAGEIYVGGAGVSRGYLNRPDLTAERFVSDPFSAVPQTRMYKTGDMGRWRADGTLEYLGRNDHQVKIRGHRIELGEIEAQVAKHEPVKEVVVVVREDIQNDRRLVAYITVSQEPCVCIDELRVKVRSTLPEYMVPSAFVVLDQLPLTPSGKLDRRALPAPEREAHAGAQYEEPRGEVEEALAGIWRELLRLEGIGRRDNFFDLGGHSLLATRVVAHIGDVLDIDLPLRVMFEEPTIEALGRWILRETDVDAFMEAS